MRPDGAKHLAAERRTRSFHLSDQCPFQLCRFAKGWTPTSLTGIYIYVILILSSLNFSMHPFRVGYPERIEVKKVVPVLTTGTEHASKRQVRKKIEMY